MKTIARRHNMPFGAELLDDKQVRFRLWAPAAERVDVCLLNSPETNAIAGNDNQQTLLPMTAEPQGWFTTTTHLATAGSHYRFRINDSLLVPDPASRFQPQDVHGPSEVVDPCSWIWQDAEWTGRPWEETIIYELHVGCFTAQGSFAGVLKKLDYLVELGITAIQLMPVADFPGARNWGYDGVYLFAPDSRYGRPDDLKALIDAAHARDLMIFLDVVYNHFGPEGNYLHAYASPFFSQHLHTPWGVAINFDGNDSYWVRQFFIDNAIYWLEEFHFDGLRFDAVHTILNDSQPDFLTELAERVHHYFGTSRHIHLVLENDNNAAHYLTPDTTVQPQWYVAQWNDDFHHALHVLLTGEISAHYMDYAHTPIHHLGRCLSEGFAYQGEQSEYRENQSRGESSAHLPPTAFVSFLQNHDQVGNRACGERLNSLTTTAQFKAALSLLLLSPSPPLLFMGQEWGCTQPFPFFCDFGPDLAAKVVAGRHNEFARLAKYANPAAREHIPNPVNKNTFEQAVLQWSDYKLPQHQYWLKLHRELLAIRRRELIPRLRNIGGRQQSYSQLSEQALTAHWLLGDGSELVVFANLGHETLDGIHLPKFQVLYSTHSEVLLQAVGAALPPWSVVWYL